MILGINIDHIGTLRQARLGIEPDPVMAATLAILGGADGITLHLREDRRHVNDRDLDMLKGFVAVELNLEMAATEEMLRIAAKKLPADINILIIYVNLCVVGPALIPHNAFWLRWPLTLPAPPGTPPPNQAG